MKDSIITVDYDGTIGDYFGGELNPRKKIVRDWIKRLMRLGYDIHIVTRRYGPKSIYNTFGEYKSVLDFADSVGISQENVHFTNRDWKFYTLQRLNSSIHLDDDIVEKQLINQHVPNINAICVEDVDWEQQLKDRLSKNDAIKIWISSEKNLYNSLLILGIVLLILLITM